MVSAWVDKRKNPRPKAWKRAVIDYHQPKPLEVAWAAGFFEGEGCWKVRETANGAVYCSAYVNSTDRDMLEQFVKCIGFGKVHGPYQGRPSAKPFYSVELVGFEQVQYLAGMFWPWLCKRRRDRVREILVYVRDVWEERYG